MSDERPPWTAIDIILGLKLEIEAEHAAHAAAGSPHAPLLGRLLLKAAARCYEGSIREEDFLVVAQLAWGDVLKERS